MKKFIFGVFICLIISVSFFPATVYASNVAEVNGVEYATIQQALDAAKSGDTINLLADSDIDSPVSIEKAITIEGNNCEIYYTGSYAALIILNSETKESSITLKNIRIVAKKAETGISYEVEKGQLTLDNIVIRGYGGDKPVYPLFMTADCSGAVININNCSLTGHYGINVWGQNMTININDTEIYSYSEENVAAIVLNRGDVYNAENTVINITKSKIVAADKDDNPTVAILNKTLTAKVNIDEQSEIKGEIKEVIAFVGTVEDSTLFFKLQDAINYGIEKNRPVEIIRNINEKARIEINGKVEINGNGLMLTSSSHEIISIKTADEVIIENCNIIGISDCVYGLTIDYKPVTLKLNNVTISGQRHIAVYVCWGAESSKLFIRDCDLTGCYALGVYGEKTEVEINNTKLTSINNDSKPDAAKHYSGAILIYVNDVKVKVFEGSITTLSSEDKPLACVIHVPGNNAENMDVYLDTEIIAEGTAEIIGFESNSQHIIKVRQEYKQKLNDEGFAVTKPDDKGMIEIDYSKKVNTVTYMIDGKEYCVIKVQDGDSVKDVPVVPIKDGYTGKWDHDGTNITVDTTINAVYTKEFLNLKMILLLAVVFVIVLIILIMTTYKKKNKIN